MDYAKILDDTKNEVYKAYLTNEVFPILDRYNWVVYWGNGCVAIDNCRGHDVESTKTAKALMDHAAQTFGIDSGYCGIMWDLVSVKGIANGVYGPYNVPCRYPLKMINELTIDNP